LASAVAMDKPMAKKILEAEGLRCPQGKTLSTQELFAGEPMKRPYVVKRSNEGSSVGVYIVLEEDNRSLAMIMGAPPADTRFLVEEYIPGQEITVAVLNDKPLGVTEIRPKSGFYDYTNKYTDGKSEH